MENVIQNINRKLNNWYKNAKQEYGVIGRGHAIYNKENNEIEIHYTENGVQCVFKHYWHSDFNKDTIFDIWQTEANPDNDKI